VINPFPKIKSSQIICILVIHVLLFLTIINQAFCDFTIVQNGKPVCSIIIPKNPSEQEKFAISELNFFIDKFTGTALEQKSDANSLPSGNIILIGTYETNRYINDLYMKSLLPDIDEFKDEGFIIRNIKYCNQHILVIAGNPERGIIYGVYRFIEELIGNATALKPADLDFNVPRVTTLSIKDISIRSKPFYPTRCTISQEDPAWLSRHRVNISGAEGVWSGTGIDDGLGTAFKYVYDSQFEDMQDESTSRRMKRVNDLRNRLWALKDKGIETYLFMYVMGEPTKAMMQNHPELLEADVKYQNSRNGDFYQPISWTKPASRELIKKLVKSIIQTYSPALTGFHLRSWGWETRAPAGDSAQLQSSLWEVYSDIISAAREVDPNFKFIVSGYNSTWLKDPDFSNLSRLPKRTILMQKWGVDGEPTNDPEINVDFINNVDRYGHKVVIISHDVEEVMPLWMVEADLFAEGLRKYSVNTNLTGLGGFTLQGESGLSHLDRIVSSRLNYDPDEDYIAIMKNYLSSNYTEESAQYILNGIRQNTKVLSDYFSDYAGTLSLTGGYGNGSRGYATRLWNLIGETAVRDTLSIPNTNTVDYAKKRLTFLLPRQQDSANEVYTAGKSLYPSSDQALSDYTDAMHLMKMWACFFESRLCLVEAREIGLKGGSYEQLTQKISSAIEYSKEMSNEISEIKDFVNVFDYTDDKARESLLDLINEEIEFLGKVDPEMMASTGDQNKADEDDILAINDVFLHPNPASKSATFCYTLGSSADNVIITIYTISGRRIKTINCISTDKGYNEESWDTKDEAGNRLSNGTYLYKIVAKKDDKRIQKISKLSIIR
jgi:hypothetical protein